jgi:hypothetical protein
VQFKLNFVEGYIDKSLDRLLDLRNAIKKATSIPEVKALLNAEQAYIKRYYNIEENDEKKERRSSPKHKSETDSQT